MEDLATTLRAWANQVSRKEFLLRAPGRYLLITVSPTDDGALGFDTKVGSRARLQRAVLAAEGRRIVALAKTERSPYSNISVGRARNCDVVLRESSVSKLHAHFLARDGSWEVVDRGSINGTLLNGRRLTAHEPATLEPGDQVLFGAVACLFADGEILYRELGPQ